MWNKCYVAVGAVLLSIARAQQFVMYTPGGDDTAVERMDSIINPGSISQHVHQIFGSSNMSPLQTYQSLQSSTCQTVADSNGHGNADDKSVYWHPALYMEASNNTGYVRVPTNGHKIYYRKAGSPQDRLADPFEFPEGFRMIAGHNTQRAAAEDLQTQNITQWICHSPSGMNQGTSGGFPTGVSNCDAVDGFNGAIHFPHCWNGNAFNQAAPTAHMSYPMGDVQEGVCPTSHPIRLPHIFIENTFNLDTVFDQVKPNTFVLANGDPTGYGWHFDFFNGWNRGSIPALLAECPQGFYGNEDIGLCPNFNASSTPATECKLTTTFKEKVDLPGQMLPGCNPIQRTNPAVENAPVALNIITDICKAVSGGSGNDPGAPSLSSTSTPASTFTTSTTSLTISSASPTTTDPSSQPVSSRANPSATTSSSPYASSTPSAQIHCPSSNNALHTASTGQVYRIECGLDHIGGDMGMVQVAANDLAACIEACVRTTGCLDVSLSGVACYMKRSVGAEVHNGVMGARLVSSKTTREVGTPTRTERGLGGRRHARAFA